MKRITNCLAPAALVLLLAACGGGNDGTPVAADPLAAVPDSASQSSAGMAGYVGSLAAMPSETREPLSVDNFSPPKPDNSEPEPVN